MDNTTPHHHPGPHRDTHADGPSEQPRALVARDPEDLVAFVPLAVGFTPHDSVVMLTFGGPRPFHARVDLPKDADDVGDLATALLDPALKHAVRSVVFVLYGDDTFVADDTAWTLDETFRAAGIAVIDVLRVHDDHWYAVRPGAPAEAYEGVRFDISTHPFTVQAIVEGRVTRASREDLRATLAPDHEGVASTSASLRNARPLDRRRLERLVSSRMRSRTVFSDPELASVALSVAAESGREAVWKGLDRASARAAVELWSDAVRRLPGDHAASTAAVLALAAWVAGEGALAWCAVDHCRAAHPDHPVAHLVAGLLESATPPDAWQALRAAAGLHDPAA